tara:strand:- start:463 stop:738 length:276 start_codon:yes stop_codon:yes gene_type:complete
MYFRPAGPKATGRLKTNDDLTGKILDNDCSQLKSARISLMFLHTAWTRLVLEHRQGLDHPNSTTPDTSFLSDGNLNFPIRLQHDDGQSSDC